MRFHSLLAMIALHIKKGVFEVNTFLGNIFSCWLSLAFIGHHAIGKKLIIQCNIFRCLVNKLSLPISNRPSMPFYVIRFGASQWVCIVLLVGVGFLTGCKSSENKVLPKSPQVYHHPIPDLPISRFSIPVKFLISALEHEVNYHIGEILFEDKNAMDDQITMTVVKSGRLNLKPNGFDINYKFPIRIEVTYHPSKGKDKASKSFCYDLLVDFSSKFEIGNDWQLIPHTEYSGFEWVFKPKLNPKDVDLDIAGWIEKGIEWQSDDISAKIDIYLRQHLDVKSIIEEAWDLLQDPIDAPEQTVCFVPKSVSVTPLKAVGDNVELHLHVMLYTKLQPKSAKVQSKKSVLPAPIIEDWKSDTGFVSHISNKITYAQMDTLLSKKLKGHIFSFENGKQKISLDEFKCFASGDRLMIRAKMEGSISGTVYLRSSPYLDTISQCIRLRHLDFELKTKDVLVATAAWIMNGSIEDKIHKAFVIPYGEKVQAAQSHINDELGHVKAGDNLEMHTKIIHINPHSLYIAQDYIELRSTVIGNMDLILY